MGSNHLKQCWPSSQTYICSTRGRWVDWYICLNNSSLCCHKCFETISHLSFRHLCFRAWNQLSSRQFYFWKHFSQMYWEICWTVSILCVDFSQRDFRLWNHPKYQIAPKQTYRKLKTLLNHISDEYLPMNCLFKRSHAVFFNQMFISADIRIIMWICVCICINIYTISMWFFCT